MLTRGTLVVVLLVLMPATVEAFDHHHHHHHSSSGGGCSAPADDADPPSTPAPSHERVFVTSTTYTGNLGGLASADAQCQAKATSSGLSGTFRAWLSDGATSAYDRTTGAGPWYTTGDVLAFASKSDLRSAPRAALLDEYGGYPERAGSAGAWSGSDATGAASGRDCEGWTRATADVTGTTGTASELDATWGGGHVPFSCDAQLPLICIQQ